MKPYLKSCNAVVTDINNTPLTYATAYGWTGGQIKTDSCIQICSFGGTINGTHTKVGNQIYLITNSDYHTYCEYIGVKPSTLYLYIDKPDSITNAQDAYIENILDCSMCCMNQCTIVLSIFSQSYDFYDCFKTMLPGYTLYDGTKLKPTQISISWGCSESDITLNEQTLLPDLIKNSGISVFSASGDYNATNGTKNLMVDNPSSIPYIVGVGGTTITSMSPFQEKVWNSNGYGTGGGYSQIFTKPSYQTCAGDKRAIPDITAVADPETGTSLCINGKISGGYGGTSMSAPFVCSMFAICQFKYGIKEPAYSFLYKANCFNDIVIGNNKDNGLGYNAGIGYDVCSGLGSIQWNKLVQNFNPPVTLPVKIPTLLMQLQINRIYPLRFPLQYKSSAITIKNGIIYASRLGKYFVSTPSMRMYIVVLKNTIGRFALTT